MRCVPKAAIGADAVPHDLNKPRCTGLSDHRGIANKGKRQDVEFAGTNAYCTTEGGNPRGTIHMGMVGGSLLYKHRPSCSQ